MSIDPKISEAEAQVLQHNAVVVRSGADRTVIFRQEIAAHFSNSLSNITPGRWVVLVVSYLLDFRFFDHEIRVPPSRG